ncbi:MAG: AbrB/MazE/SpoVT family DNA-binding domain-containing protein [Candidatus Methanodesulfokora sp.]|jgi:bifunctional DNA-binding transcriptional regulator/antitoxin component of YhaV-PrlF toxin-antitoxin module
MELSKVSKKFLTSVPAKVRKALKIEVGDLLAWNINEEEGFAAVRVVKNPYKALCGKYQDPDLVYEAVEETADKLLMRDDSRS